MSSNTTHAMFTVLKMSQATDPLEVVQYLEELLALDGFQKTPSGITTTAAANTVRVLFLSKGHPNHAAAATKFILLVDNWWNNFKKEIKPNTGYR